MADFLNEILFWLERCDKPARTYPSVGLPSFRIGNSSGPGCLPTAHH